MQRHALAANRIAAPDPLEPLGIAIESECPNADELRVIGQGFHTRGRRMQRRKLLIA
jgi:hypothetical protein